MHRHVQAITVRRLSNEGKLLAFCELSALAITSMLNELGLEAPELNSYHNEFSPTIMRVATLLSGLHRHTCDTNTDTHCYVAVAFLLKVVNVLEYKKNVLEKYHDRAAEDMKAELEQTSVALERTKAETSQLTADIERLEVEIRKADLREAEQTLLIAKLERLKAAIEEVRSREAEWETKSLRIPR
jgi:hypothetical protein